MRKIAAFHALVWLVLVTFTYSSIPSVDKVLNEVLNIFISEAYAQEAQDAGPNTVSTPSPSTTLFTGAATTGIPIEVPPGKAGIAPKLALTYNSYQGNGWIGVGWTLDMGSIQRSTKFGVNYGASDYVAQLNGSTSDLVSRSADWGTNYYGEKIEGGLSKYQLESTANGLAWVVTSKDGTKYYYGSTSASRQDFSNGDIFKWCLDTVVDTNGNTMTISYTKNQGDIYPNQIDYTSVVSQ